MIILQIIREREKRFQIYGVVIVIFEIISIIVGWLTYKNEFILKSPYCTFYMNGTTSCPIYSNGLQNVVQTYEYCYQFTNYCGDAIKIRNIFLAGLILPLIFIFYICTLSGCFYWDYFKNKNSLLLSYTLWIVCFIICIILFFVDGDKIDELAFQSSFTVNLKIRDSSYAMGSIKLIQLFLQIFLLFDLHRQLNLEADQNHQTIVNPNPNPNNSQGYIQYSGPAQLQHINFNPAQSQPVGQPNNVQVIQIHLR